MQLPAANPVARVNDTRLWNDHLPGATHLDGVPLMRMTLLTSAAVLGLALSLPAFAQTATDPTPANPSAVKDGTPGAGTGSGAAPGNDPANSGKTGATLGAHAPQQDPGPMGATTNPSPADSGTVPPGAPPASATGMGTSGNGSDQNTPTATAPSHPHHHRMSKSANTTTGDDTASSGGHWSHQPGSGMSGPASTQASNIDSADTHSTIAPHLPQPRIGMNAGPDGYLRAADRALAAHKTGAAQQALEMAETRLLDRSAAAGSASQPDTNPRIAAVSAARKALAEKNWKAARMSIREAMNTGGSAGMGHEEGGMASDSGSTMPAGSMGSGTVSPTPNPGNSSPPVNPTGAGPDGTHAVGTGNGGGALGTTTNDSAGGAK